MKTLPPVDKGHEYVYRVHKNTLVEYEGMPYRVGTQDGVYTYLRSVSGKVSIRLGMFTVVKLLGENNNKKEKKKNEVQKLRQSTYGSRSDKEEPGNG